ncbi:hypothetical protein RhiirA5_502571 [Rhizophagus irregularis]|uniref:Uncharacterized protein n=1 Tax=Rhizophagus irregularis TaxID=588596 RepID=A0A2N0PD54_9GLOM|nr:hypothetical protein RhiirA5_502571 [Rhizophagus irregularis]
MTKGKRPKKGRLPGPEMRKGTPSWTWISAWIMKGMTSWTWILAWAIEYLPGRDFAWTMKGILGIGKCHFFLSQLEMLHVTNIPYTSFFLSHISVIPEGAAGFFPTAAMINNTSPDRQILTIISIP